MSTFETEQFRRIQNLVTPPMPAEEVWKADALDFMAEVGVAPTFYGWSTEVMDHIRECGLDYDLCTTPGEDRIASFDGTENEPQENDAITAHVMCKGGCTCASGRFWDRNELCHCGHAVGVTIAVPPMSVGQLLTLVDAWKTERGR